MYEVGVVRQRQRARNMGAGRWGVCGRHQGWCCSQRCWWQRLGLADRGGFDAGWLFHRGLCPRDAAAVQVEELVQASGDPPCAAPTFDDSSWRSLSVPHDWSREDLPARDVDTEYPVVGARYGQWRLKAGDNASWASPTLDDSGWQAAVGGMDWRAYGLEFQGVNATGWYRQHLPARASRPGC